ncbi:MAG: VWA domain-containing protein [Sulfurimonas sp.]
MEFLHPEFLYFMLPPVFILFALLLTQKETQATFFSDEVLDKLRVSANTLTMRARNALFLLMAVLLVIALAHPVIKEGEIEIEAKSADIILGLDISDSMLAEDLYPSRLRLAKDKALELLKLSPSERISVIAFAKNSYMVAPLSMDHDVVAFLLDKLDTGSITEKGTNFLSMLEVVNNSIKSDQKKYLLVLSDGGDQKDFSKEIDYAKTNNIVVFVIGIATKKGAPIKQDNGAFIKQNGKVVISKLNSNISDLAVKTGGVYIEGVNSDQDIKAIYREIESVAKKKELKSKKIEKYIPLFYYPLGLAMIIFLIATSSMSKRKEVLVPPAVLLMLALFANVPLQAGILDFKELNDAKSAYENGEYKKAQSIYKNYADTHTNDASYYNSANALYKQKEYKKAIENYKKAHFIEKDFEAKKYANIGNSYAKVGDEKSLKSAIEAYENSLKLDDDKDVRENLEAVKKALEKRKQQQKKQDQKNKQNKNDKNKQQEKQENEKKDSQQQNGSKGDKQQDQKQNQKKQKQQKDEQQKQEEQKKKGDEQKTSQKKEQEKQKEEKLSSQQGVVGQKHKDMMSEAEEKKWLKALNKKQKTFLYQLNKDQKIRRSTDEKPW